MVNHLKMKKADKDKLIAKIGLEETNRLLSEQRRKLNERVKADPERLAKKREQGKKHSAKQREKGAYLKPEWLKAHIEADPTHYCYMNLIAGYRRADREKNRAYDLDIAWALEKIAGKECTYCGTPSTIEKPTGVDRVDSSIGHLKTNCVPCCKSCNSLKGDRFSFEEMVIIGSKIKGVRPEFRTRVYEHARNFAKEMVKQAKKGIKLSVENFKVGGSSC